jgi:hypothetical protein
MVSINSDAWNRKNPGGSFAIDETRSGIMAGWRRAVELAMSNEEITQLAAVSRSRTERASRVERAQMLLAYHENPSFFAAARTASRNHVAGPWPPLRHTRRLDHERRFQSLDEH